MIGLLEQDANVTGPLMHVDCLPRNVGSLHDICSVTSKDCGVEGYGVVICRPPGTYNYDNLISL